MTHYTLNGLGRAVLGQADELFWERGPSRVHGHGIIIKRFLRAGTGLGPTHIPNGAGWDMLPLGNYNHSERNENAVIVVRETFMEVFLIKDLHPGDEMLVDFTKQVGFEQPFPGWEE